MIRTRQAKKQKPEIYNAKEKISLLYSAKYWLIIAIGAVLVSIQGTCAHFDGYFSQAQIIEVHGIRNAYAFLEHGGMWSDVFIVTPIVAYIMCRYRLPYYRWIEILLLVVTIFVCFAAGIMYQEVGKIFPEAHTHFGYTPLAGWIHGLYAIAVIWICALFYLTRVAPQPSKDMIVLSSGLSVHVVLGVMKFNPYWSLSKEALVQITVSIAMIWVVTAYKLGRYRDKKSQ